MKRRVVRWAAQLSLSRVRWGLSGLLAAVGLVASGLAWTTYLRAGLVLGVLAVATLGIITVVGMASLAFARRRIHEELVQLAASPPGGSLLEGRRARLEAIKAAGARPDLGALAEATAAQEASRAYLGRYLVATTVLVGLVGTFAGLMETLGKVAPLLSEESANHTLSLLAAPLAGLHVTFGASLVAIVVTLALSLAQGDLVLHEEQALATLEDLTHHHLVPALWPRTEDAAERTVAALTHMETQIAKAVAESLSEATLTLNRTQEQRFVELAAKLGGAAETTSRAVSTYGESSAATLAKTAAGIETSVSALAAQVSDRLSEATQQQLLQMTQAVTRLTERLESQKQAVAKTLGETAATVMVETAHAVEASTAALGATLSPLFAREAAGRQDVQQALASNVEAMAAMATRISEVAQGASAETSEALARAAHAHAEILAQTTTHVSEALARAVTQVARSEERAVQALAEAASRQTEALHETAAQVAHSERQVVETLTGLATKQGAFLAEAAAQVARSEAQAVAALADAATAHGESLTQAASRLSESGREAMESLAQTARQHAEALADATAQVVAGLGETTVKSGERLNQAAERLVDAAKAFDGTLAPLGPRLAALTTELERMTHEVALLAAQSDATHGSAMVLAELERVGDGLERLASLVRLSREPEASEIQEARS
ncbi:MAG: hypothetical protein KA712_18145 [Myxococcales bacterium]|nr:hypothetical protein [Myxococcales bacterium]